jgi:hypothetical protein
MFAKSTNAHLAAIFFALHNAPAVPNIYVGVCTWPQAYAQAVLSMSAHYMSPNLDFIQQYVYVFHLITAIPAHA